MQPQISSAPTGNDSGNTPATQEANKFKQETGVDVFTGPKAGLIPHKTAHGLDYVDPGYAYITFDDLGSVNPLTNAKSVMRMLQSNPQAFFQFRIETNDGKGVPAIYPGARLVLYARDPTGNVGPSPVVVEDVTDTQFTFRTLPGHFDGPNALISFRTYEAGGRVRLQHSAWAPEGSPWNAWFAKRNIGGTGWPEMATKLRTAISNSDMFFRQ
jgi:hypothetical protein